MSSQFKLVIYNDGKVVETVDKQAGTRSSDLIKSLEEFQKSANAALTKLIESRGDSSKWLMYFLIYHNHT